jgi:hypothetical protein
MMGISLFSGSHTDQYEVEFMHFAPLASNDSRTDALFRPPALCQTPVELADDKHALAEALWEGLLPSRMTPDADADVQFAGTAVTPVPALDSTITAIGSVGDTEGVSRSSSSNSVEVQLADLAGRVSASARHTMAVKTAGKPVAGSDEPELVAGQGGTGATDMRFIAAWNQAVAAAQQQQQQQQHVQQAMQAPSFDSPVAAADLYTLNVPRMAALSDLRWAGSTTPLLDQHTNQRRLRRLQSRRSL